MFLRTSFQGTHYQIGYQFGGRLKGLYIPQADSRRRRFALRCEAIVKEIYPPILEKVERLIEGSSLEATDFKTYFYTRSGPPQIGCTGFTILPPYAKDGWLLLGATTIGSIHLEKSVRTYRRLPTLVRSFSVGVKGNGIRRQVPYGVR